MNSDRSRNRPRGAKGQGAAAEAGPPEDGARWRRAEPRRKWRPARGLVAGRQLETWPTYDRGLQEAGGGQDRRTCEGGDGERWESALIASEDGSCDLTELGSS
jgi:hypothetical protein